MKNMKHSMTILHASLIYTKSMNNVRGTVEVIREVKAGGSL